MSDEINSIQLSPRLGDSYSDVTIIFSDPRTSVAMRLHRALLAWLVPYFDTLFLFSENLKKEEFNIPVEDAVVAELFIKSLYGLKVDFTRNCYNFLHLCKLRSYFCLDVDLEQLNKIKVPAENFDLFLQVVNLPEIKLGRIISSIRRNLPVDYKWEGVNEDFKREVMRKEDLIITGDEKGVIKIWDMNILQGEIQPENVDSEVSGRILTGHEKEVRSIFISKDRKQIVSGEENTIKIWNLASGEHVETYYGHGIRITKDLQHIITNNYWGDIKIRNTATKETRSWDAHKGFILTMVITEDQQQIISSDNDTNLIFWNIATGEYVKSIGFYKDSACSIAITEDPQQIVFGMESGRVKIRNIATGECVKTLNAGCEPVRSVFITKDQQKIISEDVNEFIIIWNVATGEIVGKTAGIILLIIDNQQQMVVSTYDRKIEIWNIATGERVRTLTGFKNRITSMALLSNF